MWTIEQQIQKIKGMEFPVDVKLSKFRPASAKEKQVEEVNCKPMTATLSLTFRHSLGGGLFKITAQFRKPKPLNKQFNVTVTDGVNLVDPLAVEETEGRWMFNLHEPPRTVAVETRVKRADMVTAPTGKTRIEKTSSGTHPLDVFFDRIFPVRVRDDAFVNLVANKFDEALSEMNKAA